MHAPRVDDLPEPLARAARWIARTLAEHGERGWLVGGAVRDLALGRRPHEIDMACRARPEEIESLFPRTHAVGRAFGTIVVVCEDDQTVELTTFRSDGTYTDGRRPDSVSFGDTPEQDARRRDFTCNALYLDPLTDEVLDPTGGLTDLRGGRLATVGDARARFQEDALRILRLGRMAGSLGLAVDDALAAAARDCAVGLTSVSRERVLGELAALFARPNAAESLALLDRVGALAVAMPEADAGPAARAVVTALGTPVPLELGLAVLLQPAARDRAAALGVVAELRASRATRKAVQELWEGLEGLRSVGDGDRADPSSRARLVRLGRSDGWPLLERLAAARVAALDDRAVDPAPVRALLAGASREELFPPPLLDAGDLERAGVPRGPRWGELLAEAEELTLGGALRDREAALRWLDDRVRSGDGA